MALYIAHISEDGRIQTCQEHSRNTALLSQNTLSTSGLGYTAYLSGLLHDCGKYTTEFSEYIKDAVEGKGKKGSVIHSFAGGSYILKKYHSLKNGSIDFRDLAAELIAVSIISHHGLVDLVNEEGSNGFDRRKIKQPEYDQRAASAFIKECAQEKEIDSLFEKSVCEVQTVIKRFPETDDYGEMCFYLGMLARLLTAAVVSGDREDTASFMSGKALTFSWNIDDVWQISMRALEKKIASFPSEGRLQKARRAFSDSCFLFGPHETGIYRLDLPTGAGKTLCALRFAIRHAQLHRKKHIYYVAPLLSILEQNAEVIRDAVGNGNWILEHHSNILQDKDGEDLLQNSELLQESWETPYIITTLVRLLETLFSHRMSDVRRFQALCDSIIIIDEVQSLPSKMLSIFNCAMNFLTNCCHTTIVLCSATQPPFEQARHRMDISSEPIIDSEILRNYSALFKRTEITYEGSYTTNELPDYLMNISRESSSLLVVCNTKVEAAELYDLLKELPVALFHLSAGMCMEHRKKVLYNLYEALKQKKKLICVSTQVIEAGVDISFETVVRLAAGLDSVVQCAGRCNRNGESEQVRPVRVVMHADQKLGGLKEISSAQNAFNDLVTQYKAHPEKFDNDLASFASVEYYYRSLYRAMPSDVQDYPVNHSTLFSLLGSNEAFLQLSKVAGAYGMNQAFKTAASLFSVFDDDTRSILVPFEKGTEFIEKLESEATGYSMDRLRDTLRRAKGYDVSVPTPQLNQLRQMGAVRTICNESIFIAEPYCYDDNTGVLSVKKIKERMEKCGTLIL